MIKQLRLKLIMWLAGKDIMVLANLHIAPDMAKVPVEQVISVYVEEDKTSRMAWTWKDGYKKVGEG